MVNQTQEQFDNFISRLSKLVSEIKLGDEVIFMRLESTPIDEDSTNHHCEVAMNTGLRGVLTLTNELSQHTGIPLVIMEGMYDEMVGKNKPERETESL